MIEDFVDLVVVISMHPLAFFGLVLAVAFLMLVASASVVAAATSLRKRPS